MSPDRVDPQLVLNCPMQPSTMAQPNDADAATVRDYLVALVRQLWIEGEGFSGKRPFGNSSWECQIYAALGKAELIHASFDEDGYLRDVDTATADALVLAAIEHLRTAES